MSIVTALLGQIYPAYASCPVIHSRDQEIPTFTRAPQRRGSQSNSQPNEYSIWKRCQEPGLWEWNRKLEPWPRQSLQISSFRSPFSGNILRGCIRSGCRDGITLFCWGCRHSLCGRNHSETDGQAQPHQCRYKDDGLERGRVRIS